MEESRDAKSRSSTISVRSLTSAFRRWTESKEVAYAPIPLPESPQTSMGSNHDELDDEDQCTAHGDIGDGSQDHLGPERAILERQLVQKLDYSLMPILFLMIILNYLDRNALPNARIQGIEADLNLKGYEFNAAISILFVGYIGLQIPSNMLLTRVRPSIYLPTCMALWGLISASTAMCKNFSGLLLTRFLLGFTEAPFFPGALFLLSSWYTKRELATRTAVLYTGSLLSGGFGGLLGAGVEYSLDGVAGWRSWQWLFIIEGLTTVALSLFSIFILPDFPATTRWLTVQERNLAVRRLLEECNEPHSVHGISLFSGVYLAVTDYKVWLLAAVVLTKTSAAAVTSFIPTLVAGFGFGRVDSLLLVAPPYVFAAVVAMLVSISSDKFCERYSHLVLPLLVGAAGFVVAAATIQLVPRYCALFLMLGGVYGGFNVGVAWVSSTLPLPLEKRAVGLAIVNMVGNFAQIYSPYLYDKRIGPRYLHAMVANTLFVLASIAIASILRVCLASENRKLEREETLGNRETGSSFRYVL